MGIGVVANVLFSQQGDTAVDLWSWENLGVVATALAVGGGALGFFHWVRATWQRRFTLGPIAAQLEGINASLILHARTVSKALANGVPWDGATAPPQLADSLGQLLLGQRELDYLRARLRGLRAEPSVDRLRQDLESAASCLRPGTTLYLRGTWVQHGLLRGEPCRAGDNDPLPGLGAVEGAVAEIEQLHPQVELLIRSAWYQLGDDDRAARFQAIWPTSAWQLNDESWDGLIASDRSRMSNPGVARD